MNFLNGKKAVFSVGDVAETLVAVGHLVKCDLNMSRSEANFTDTDSDGQRYAGGLVENTVSGTFNYVTDDAALTSMGVSIGSCANKFFSVTIKDCAEATVVVFSFEGFVKSWNVSNITNDGSSVIQVNFEIRVDGVITETIGA